MLINLSNKQWLSPKKVYIGVKYQKPFIPATSDFYQFLLKDKVNQMSLTDDFMKKG